MNVISIENGMNTFMKKMIFTIDSRLYSKRKMGKGRGYYYHSVINKCDDMEIIHSIPTLIDKEDMELYEQIVSYNIWGHT